MNIEENGGFRSYEDEIAIRAAMEALTRQIGGRLVDLEHDLKTLCFMKRMLADVGKVTVSRTTHDQGFLEMLMANKRLMRLAGIELFDDYNRRMMVTMKEERRKVVMMPWQMRHFDVKG